MITIKERKNETHPFASCSPVVALPRAVALRVLSTGEVMMKVLKNKQEGI